MDFGRITDPNAWRSAMANLLRRGEEVGTYIESAPQKAGQAIVDAGQRQRALMAQAFDPTGKTLIRDPQAANQAAMNLFEGPLGIAPAGITAWHGSPHTFEKFDISKVGTGEGAQVYGHGMYFAEAPEVAKEYQRRLSADSSLNYQARNVDPAYIHAAKSFKDYGSTYEETLKGLKQAYKNAPEKELDIAAKVTFQPTGSLYKVDIPDEYIPQMIKWDKEVPEDVRKKLSDVAMKQFGSGLTGTSGEKLYKDLAFSLKQSGSQNPFADAAKWLNEQGIKGISYLDQGSRTSKITSTPINQLDARIEILKKDIESGLGNQEVMKQKLKNLEAERAKSTNLTSNFVVFDPTDVKILERNNQPMTRKEVIEEQVNKLK